MPPKLHPGQQVLFRVTALKNVSNPDLKRRYGNNYNDHHERVEIVRRSRGKSWYVKCGEVERLVAESGITILEEGEDSDSDPDGSAANSDDLKVGSDSEEGEGGEQSEDDDVVQDMRAGASLHDWTVQKSVDECQRRQDKFSEPVPGKLRRLQNAGQARELEYFWQFWPVHIQDDVLRAFKEQGQRIFGPGFNITRGLFWKWLGLWLRMTLFCGPSREQYFKPQLAPGKVDFGFSAHMSFNQFQQITRALNLPTAPEPRNAAQPDSFRPVRKFMEACNTRWQDAYEPATHIVVDETMLFWTGQGEAHLTYLPRKPTPLGIMFKTLVDGESCVLLNMEPCEGKEVDRRKEFMDTMKRQSTATTLRLAKPWFNTGRIVVGDSWFGSCQTVEELLENGLYSVMCVKTAHSGYPKEKVREACKERGDKVFLAVDVTMDDGVREKRIYAAGHVDKKPLHVVASCGLSKPGKPKIRHRYYLQDGKVKHKKYVLEQPEMLATYRNHFNAVDRFNRYATGPKNLTEVWDTKDVFTRVFAQLVSFIEVNGFLAYRAHHFFGSGKEITRQEWREALSSQLIANPYTLAEETIPQTPSKAPPEVAEHTTMVRLPDKKQKRCVICSFQTRRTCACGDALCDPVSNTCYCVHLREVATGLVEERRRLRFKSDNQPAVGDN